MEQFILEAQSYFKEEEWSVFDESEKYKYAQVCYIYYACTHLGIFVVVPDFMTIIRHDKYEIQVENVVHKCQYCNIAFILQADNEKHMEKCRKRFDFIQKKEYACDKCNYSTNYVQHINRHRLTHTNKKEYLCDICQKTFISKLGLKNHVNNIHLKTEKDLKCGQCSYETNNKSQLRSHMRIHSDFKKFICEFCNRGFNQQQQLKRHSLKHDTRKPITCSICDKSFLTKSYLTEHINAIHFRNQKFGCDQCQYTTLFKHHLKRHSYTHLKDKPNKCHLCDFSSCTFSHLRHHLKNKHGM